jgi:hypothetical protein
MLLLMVSVLVVDNNFSFSPGELKDFMKKINLEDVKAGTRRRQLQTMMANAEARKAKAAAAAISSPAPSTPTPTPTPDISVKPPPKTETPPSPEKTPSRPTSTLHPSLPAKPGSISPASKVEAPEIKPVEPPAPAPVPAAKSPPPVVEKVIEKPAVVIDLISRDEQLKKIEEVKHLFKRRNEIDRTN